MERWAYKITLRRFNITNESPLAQHILEQPLPKGFKFPTLDVYSGKTDPASHVYKFQTSMSVQTNEDYIWCKFFPTTLQGNAADWYKTLPPRSIHSFRQLTTAFRQRFAASIQQKKVSSDLFSIQQREGEPLRRYVERFNDEIAKIEDLN